MPTILAIDDKQDNLVVVSALLKNLINDCVVVKALSGQEGIEKARSGEIDTILLDIQMPGMDGFETCRALRSDDETRSIPVIMLTAINTDSKSMVKALELGADAFLSKPFDNAELTAQVRAMLRIRKNENLLREEKKILEEKVSEKTRELFVSREKYEDLYENAPNMFLSIEPGSSKILQCNNAWVRNTGYSKEDVAGRPLLDFCASESMDAARKALLLFTEEGTLDEAEFLIRKKRGEKIDISLNISSVRDEEGAILYGRCVFHDITARKEMEKETKRLLKFVDSKNLELQNILYAASHDLRTPLVNINGFSQMLHEHLDELSHIFREPAPRKNIVKEAEALLTDSIPEAMSYIEGGTAKMNRLLDGLLEISRLGGQSVNIQPLNMNELTDSVIRSMTFQLKENSIKVIRDELPDCQGDEVLIGRLFANLIDNAIKYNFPGRPGVIKLAGKRDRDACVYTVEDNGLGIKPDNQPKVFQLFHRVNPYGPVAGEGLGLSIIKRILELHRGSVSLESEEGEWTRFSFSMPPGPVTCDSFLSGDSFE